MAKIDISVRELVDLIKRNELRLPELQRRFVWTGPRVRDLFDSLYRGYPSGTILVWETSDENVPTRALAIKTSEKKAFSSYKLLLDGQQRLTSLSVIMRGEPVHVKHRTIPIEIYFNLEHPEEAPKEITEVDENEDFDDTEISPEEKEETLLERLKEKAFVVGVKALKNNPIWVSVSDIFIKNDREILQPLGITSDDPKWDKYSERLGRVRKIADYQYVMHVLEPSLSYEDVAEIFVRVNSLGAKLRSSDLALAQITAHWRGSADLFEKYAEELRKLHGFELDTGLLVRTLVVMATNQSRFRNIGPLIKDVSRLQDSWEKAKFAIDYATKFLTSNAGIDTLDLLSSPLLMIPIGVYSVMKDEEFSKTEEKAMLRWFYLAHMWRHFGLGSSETILDTDLSTLKKSGSFIPLIQIIKQQVGRFKVEPADLENKDTRSPFFSMMYLVMKSKGAKDWATRLKISQVFSDSSHSLQVHHIFPKASLKKDYLDKMINDIANLTYIGGKTNRKISNNDPSLYLKKILEEQGKESLEKQFVPLVPTLWELSAFPDFLKERRKLIAEAINNFLARLD